MTYTPIDTTVPDFLRRETPKKPLVYSYTLLNTYRNICPYQAYRRYIRKDLPFVESEAMQFGNKVHSALELRVGGGKPLPQDMQQWEKFAAPLAGAKAKAEQKLGITRTGEACGFFDDNVWFRGKADVAIVSGTSAMLFDYKTSKKPREDPFELECQALMLQAKHPDLTSISACYIWLAENRIGQKHDVSRTRDTLTYVQRIAADLEEDMRNNEFEKRKGGLCPYCNVVDCENFSGGNGR